MNEKGVAIGMMALPEAQAPFNPQNKSLNSLQVIRLVLDYAKNTEEAIGLIQKYNVQMDGGPPIHYLIADVSGKSAVVEFVSGRMEGIRNLEPWQVSTNFTIYGSAALTSPLDAPCWRYRTVYKALSESGGRISQEGAVDLLNSSSQAMTIWSIAYGMSTGDISVAVGRKYSEVKKYRLQMSN
jgi:choloylglycine hydrolase